MIVTREDSFRGSRIATGLRFPARPAVEERAARELRVPHAWVRTAAERIEPSTDNEKAASPVI